MDNTALARRYRIAGIVCIVLAIALWPTRKLRLNDAFRAAVPIVCWISALAGASFLKRARQYRSISVRELLAADKRPCVLYLRSFEQDEDAARHASGGLSFLRYGVLSFLSTSTEEEQIAKVVNEIGPLVAIGRPGEELPVLGAAREQVGDDAWRGRVVELMSEARILILRAGDSEGLWWEFENAFKRMPRERIVMLVPLKQAEYEAFRRKAIERLSIELPEYAGGRSVFGSLRGLIYFDSDGTPRFVRLGRPFFRTGLTEPLVASLKIALRPIFGGLQVPYSSPPVRWYTILPFAVAGAIPFVLYDARSQVERAMELSAEEQRLPAADQLRIRQARLATLNVQLGETHLKRGQPDKAIQSFERALRLAPSLARARLGLGLALIDTGKPVEARPHFEAAALDADTATRDAARQALARIPPQ